MVTKHLPKIPVFDDCKGFDNGPLLEIRCALLELREHVANLRDLANCQYTIGQLATDLELQADRLHRHIAGLMPKDGEASDQEILDWLDNNIFNREYLDLFNKPHPTHNMWVTFAPKGVQGSARRILSAAVLAERKDAEDSITGVEIK